MRGSLSDIVLVASRRAAALTGLNLNTAFGSELLCFLVTVHTIAEVLPRGLKSLPHVCI